MVEWGGAWAVLPPGGRNIALESTLNVTINNYANGVFIVTDLKFEQNLI